MRHVIPFSDPGLGQAWDRAFPVRVRVARHRLMNIDRFATARRQGQVANEYQGSAFGTTIAPRLRQFPTAGVSTIGEIHGLGFKGIKRLRKKLHKIAPHRMLMKHGGRLVDPGGLVLKRRKRGPGRRRRPRGHLVTGMLRPLGDPYDLGDPWEDEAEDYYLGDLGQAPKKKKKKKKRWKGILKKVVIAGAIGTAAYFTGGAALKFAPKLIGMIKKPKGGAIDYARTGFMAEAAPPLPGSVEYYERQPGAYGADPGALSPYPYAMTRYASPIDPAGAMPGELERAAPMEAGMLGGGIMPIVLVAGGALLLTTLMAQRPRR